MSDISMLACTTIAYKSGNSTMYINARIGKKVFKVSEGGASVAICCRRFLVKYSELNKLPVPSDEIQWNGRRYKLGCPDGGAPWRWHGNANTDIAIYATDFGAVPVPQPPDSNTP